MNPRAFYHLGYRFFRMPWEIGPREELVALVTEGTLRPGRAVDLGCGTGANAVFLAQHGFDVTGIDFAPAGLAKARASAARAGVSERTINSRRDRRAERGDHVGSVRFVEADLTKLPAGLGPFDVLVDYGTLDDLSPTKRDRYLANVVPLAAPGSRFLLWCFEWPPRRFDLNPMAPGEVTSRFGDEFVVDRIAGTEVPNLRRLIPGNAVYLMTRRPAS